MDYRQALEAIRSGRELSSDERLQIADAVAGKVSSVNGEAAKYRHSQRDSEKFREVATKFGFESPDDFETKLADVVARAKLEDETRGKVTAKEREAAELMQKITRIEEAMLAKDREAQEYKQKAQDRAIGEHFGSAFKGVFAGHDVLMRALRADNKLTVDESDKPAFEHDGQRYYGDEALEQIKKLHPSLVLNNGRPGASSTPPGAGPRKPELSLGDLQRLPQEERVKMQNKVASGEVALVD